ncbi:MAG: hypothetical protein R3272_01180 [Candidatus Promineifilaceae bacterium]|nr:hypothetical protein [Candidatus Promineifilaceae bacterium]
MEGTRSGRRLGRAPQLWVGLALIAIFWPLNWMLEGLRTHFLFFPLWLGYTLAVDGLVFLRRGTSLLRRNWRAYVGLFVVSAPLWWLFEAINLRTLNWQYLGESELPFVTRSLLKTVAFSTVIPAVFGTAELVSTWGSVRRLRRGPRLRPVRPILLGFLVTGVVMFALMMIWPRIFYPFIWLSLYFILAPVNAALGNRSLAGYTAFGDWRPVLALMLGTLICGFFWELWNYYAYPKWIYHVPPFEFLYIFEMPLLGYGGYLPFGLELFALYHLIVGLLGVEHLQQYVQFEG